MYQPTTKIIQGKEKQHQYNNGDSIRENDDGWVESNDGQGWEKEREQRWLSGLGWICLKA